MIEIRLPKLADAESLAEIASAALGPRRAKQLVKMHLEKHQLIVAESDGKLVGLMAYRTDWFDATFVSYVVVHEDHRRKGIAREFFRTVEKLSPAPRLFSSASETNAVAIRMHSALGFVTSGHIDNLPSGARELLFYKRIPPKVIAYGEE